MTLSSKSQVKLVLGECIEKMKKIPDGVVDLVVCDLPYGTTACKWDSVIPFAELWVQYKRITKPGSPIVLTCSQPFTTALIHSNMGNFKFSWVWDKKFAGNFALSKYQPQKVHEDIAVFSYGTCKFYPQKTKRDVPIKLGGNKCKAQASSIKHAKPEYEGKVYGDKNPASIIQISNRSEPRGFHPTQKPVALMEYLIRTYSDPRELVLDNCMGSGTTGIACINTGRNFIGIEQDPVYFEVAQKRIFAALDTTVSVVASIEEAVTC